MGLNDLTRTVLYLLETGGHTLLWCKSNAVGSIFRLLPLVGTSKNILVQIVPLARQIYRIWITFYHSCRHLGSNRGQKLVASFLAFQIRFRIIWNRWKKRSRVCKVDKGWAKREAGWIDVEKKGEKGWTRKDYRKKRTRTPERSKEKNEYYTKSAQLVEGLKVQWKIENEETNNEEWKEPTFTACPTADADNRNYLTYALTAELYRTRPTKAIRRVGTFQTHSRIRSSIRASPTTFIHVCLLIPLIWIYTIVILKFIGRHITWQPVENMIFQGELWKLKTLTRAWFYRHDCNYNYYW